MTNKIIMTNKLKDQLNELNKLRSSKENLATNTKRYSLEFLESSIHKSNETIIDIDSKLPKRNKTIWGLFTSKKCEQTDVKTKINEIADEQLTNTSNNKSSLLNKVHKAKNFADMQNNLSTNAHLQKNENTI